MNEQMAVQLHPDTRRPVLRMLEHGGDPRSIEQVVDAALKDWLAAATVTNPGAAAAASRGYQWKSLFLPEGTLLRLCVGAQYTEAVVCGDHIVYQGCRCSPRQFVMQVTGQVRNAWLALWIRCPGDARWHLADTRRHLLRRARPAAVQAITSGTTRRRRFRHTMNKKSPADFSAGPCRLQINLLRLLEHVDRLPTR